ncbi:hypothetical protein K523DRAFT_255869, partial [Schizophyllum commune Tattone D]
PLPPPPPSLLLPWRIALAALVRIAEARLAHWGSNLGVPCTQLVRAAAEYSPGASTAPLAQPLRLGLGRKGMVRRGFVLPRLFVRLDNALGSRGGAVAQIAVSFCSPWLLRAYVAARASHFQVMPLSEHQLCGPALIQSTGIV